MNIVVNGLLTSYRLEGPDKAPVVLMLHGWGASAANFDELAKHMAATFRVVRLDLPGFGGTQAPPPDWHMADYAEFVAAAVKKLEIGRIRLAIGHSFGGRVLIKGIGTDILKPGKLVLLGSAGVRHSQSLRSQIFRIVAKIGKCILSLPGLGGLRRTWRTRLYAAAGSTDYLEAGPLRQVFVNTINEDLQANAAAITTPALLIWGDLDNEAPVADGQILANAIIGSRLEVLEHAGHFVHNDAPAAVAKLIDEFVV